MHVLRHSCKQVLCIFLLAHIGCSEDSDETCAADTPGGCSWNPRVIIGCWQLLERNADKSAAVNTLMSYAEAGFTAFDTADIYGPSESILGQFRKQWVAAHPEKPPLQFFTKYVTDDPGEKEANRINSQSLRHMGIQSADLVQFHWWSLSRDGSSKTFLKAGRALAKLKAQGKIKRLAGCNMDTTNLKLLVDDGMAIEANQVQYSLLDRRPEVRLLQYCKETNIKLTVFGVVAGGLLSEKLLGKTKAEAKNMLDSVSRRMYWSSLERWSKDWKHFQELLTVLKSIAERHPLTDGTTTIAMVAAAWCLGRMDDLGAGGSIILGVRDARHIKEHTALNMGVLQLGSQDMQDIQAVLDKGRPPTGDIWYDERGWA